MTCTPLFLLVVYFWIDTLLLPVVNHVISPPHFFDKRMWQRALFSPEASTFMIGKFNIVRISLHICLGLWFMLTGKSFSV